MTDANRIIIAGGGIGGLTMALTLHQIGLPCIVLESSRQMRPLGVGVNIQPNAVRELFDLGLSPSDLDTVGLPVQEWALVGLNGKEIYSESRGLLAGYQWPQYAVHRGHFHMLLYQKVVERLGIDSVKLDSRVVAYEQDTSKVVVKVKDKEGNLNDVEGSLLIGADGIHSAIRAQMHPDQPPIHWGGKVMWRGTVRAKPLRTESSFVGLGTHEHRLVIYPISKADADGYSMTNWIAEVTQDNSSGWQQDGWFREVDKEEFIHHFDSFRYEWLDVPELLRNADVAYENPMIDRDPVETWVNGRTVLMGDAAHPMYPTGSNGASQAIVDARQIGASLIQYGVNNQALKSFNEQFCKPISELVLRNRGEGPFGLLTLLNDRCHGVFDDIEAVLPAKEREQFMAIYKKSAGLAIETLNNSPATIRLT